MSLQACMDTGRLEKRILISLCRAALHHFRSTAAASGCFPRSGIPIFPDKYAQIWVVLLSLKEGFTWLALQPIVLQPMQLGIRPAEGHGVLGGSGTVGIQAHSTFHLSGSLSCKVCPRPSDSAKQLTERPSQFCKPVPQLNVRSLGTNKSG